MVRRNRRRRGARTNTGQMLVHTYQGVFAPGAGIIKLTSKNFGCLTNRPMKVLNCTLRIGLNPGPEAKAIAGAEAFTVGLYGPNQEQTISRSSLLVSAFSVKTFKITQRTSTDFGIFQPDHSVLSIYQHGADKAFGAIILARISVRYADPVDKIINELPEKFSIMDIRSA